MTKAEIMNLSLEEISKLLNDKFFDDVYQDWMCDIYPTLTENGVATIKDLINWSNLELKRKFKFGFFQIEKIMLAFGFVIDSKNPFGKFVYHTDIKDKKLQEKYDLLLSYMNKNTEDMQKIKDEMKNETVQDKLISCMLMKKEKIDAPHISKNQVDMALLKNDTLLSIEQNPLSIPNLDQKFIHENKDILQGMISNNTYKTLNEADKVRLIMYVEDKYDVYNSENEKTLD